MTGRCPVAVGVEHPRDQLLERLLGGELDQVLLVARQHQARLQLEQCRDQDEELGRSFEVELATRLEYVEVPEHHVCEVDFEQVDLLTQDQREQQVERPGEDLQVELEVGDGHRGHDASTLEAAPDRTNEFVQVAGVRRMSGITRSVFRW